LRLDIKSTKIKQKLNFFFCFLFVKKINQKRKKFFFLFFPFPKPPWIPHSTKMQQAL